MEDQYGSLLIRVYNFIDKMNRMNEDFRMDDRTMRKKTMISVLRTFFYIFLIVRKVRKIIVNELNHP